MAKTNLSSQRASAARQFVTLFRQGLCDQFNEPARLIAPLLFGVVFTVIFGFAYGEIPAAWQNKFFVAQVVLVIVLAVQMTLAQSLDSERQDMIFALLRSYPLRATVWYLAKVASLFLAATAICVPLLGATTIMHALDASAVFSVNVLIAIVLATLGMTAVGVVLATLTMQAQSRQVLYALLFMPLCAPVVICTTQALLAALAPTPSDAMQSSWLGLLVGFAVIYTTLGSVLFAELTYGD